MASRRAVRCSVFLSCVRCFSAKWGGLRVVGWRCCMPPKCEMGRWSCGDATGMLRGLVGPRGRRMAVGWP